jgi:hypothetical protein
MIHRRQEIRVLQGENQWPASICMQEEEEEEEEEEHF